MASCLSAERAGSRANDDATHLGTNCLGGLLRGRRSLGHARRRSVRPTSVSTHAIGLGHRTPTPCVIMEKTQKACDLGVGCACEVGVGSLSGFGAAAG
eukprot:3367672-Rhodomonas_salina.1